MDRNSAVRTALFVGILFVLLVASVQRWSPDAAPSNRSRTTGQVGVDGYAGHPHLVGAEIRAEDVFHDVVTVGQVAEPAAAVLSHVNAKQPPKVESREFPVFDLLNDKEYQRSRAKALSNPATHATQLPLVRSPALSKIFRQLQSRQVATTGPARQVKPPTTLSGSETIAPAQAPPHGAGSWPEPKQLLTEMSKLQHPQCQLWARQAQSGLDALRSSRAIYDPTNKAALAELMKLTQSANRLVERIDDNQQESDLLSAAYALRRRIDVWREVHIAARPGIEQRAQEIADSIDRREMLAIIGELRKALAPRKHGEAWAEYLQLEAIEAFTESSAVHDVNRRAELAGIVLARCNPETPTAQQEAFLRSKPLMRLERELRRWATQPVDLEQLIDAIERFEMSPFERQSAEVTQLWKQLRWSVLPEYAKVASAIDLHYRNANVRVSMTEEFINRMIPAMQDVKAPVREYILGAMVTGLSNSRMNLRVDFVEDEQRIRMLLRADGRNAANTQATRGAVTLHNLNQSYFQIEKPFELDRTGIRTHPSRAAASSNLSLIGMRTRYDTFPLVGRLVRRAAEQKAIETRGVSRRIVESLVARNARKQIDAQVSEQISVAERDMQHRVLQPLNEMELNPTIIALSSTADRANYRGRLAGEHQLAAFTARPRALSSNIVSFQVHDSAINNFLRQMELDGKRGELREMISSILTQLGLKKLKLPEDIPDDVHLSLANRDSVLVDCDDDRLSLTIRICELKAPRNCWRNFVVRAFYKPQTKGFQCDLYRDGSIQLVGKRLSFGDQVALRGIFTKVLSKNRPLKLIHPELSADQRLSDLSIDQFIARDGWLGVSVGQVPRVETAHRKQHSRH